jgi:hypothetical protein
MKCKSCKLGFVSQQIRRAHNCQALGRIKIDKEECQEPFCGALLAKRWSPSDRSTKRGQEQAMYMYTSTNKLRFMAREDSSLRDKVSLASSRRTCLLDHFLGQSTCKSPWGGCGALQGRTNRQVYRWIATAIQNTRWRLHVEIVIKLSIRNAWYEATVGETMHRRNDASNSAEAVFNSRKSHNGPWATHLCAIHGYPWSVQD